MLAPAEHALPSLLKRNIAMLTYVECVLRHQLCCDDLRFLPDTSSLWPVFQVLIRFPGLMVADGFRDVVASRIASLVLANREKRELLMLCQRINSAFSAREALAIIDDFTSRYTTAQRIADAVKEADSLTNRYVLLLYWLLRFRGAADFSYNSNLDESQAQKLKKLYGTEGTAPLSEAVGAERQHLVPYSTLKQIYQLEGPRPGKHPVNDLGDLTYISAGLNGLAGLAERPLALEHEPHENLERHFLANEAVLDRYKTLTDVVKRTTTSPSRLKSSYAEMCDIRKRMLGDAFFDWKERLRAAGSAGHCGGIRWARREVKEAIEDRLLTFPDDIVSCSAQLLQAGATTSSSKKGVTIQFAPATWRSVRIAFDMSEKTLLFKFPLGIEADAVATAFPRAARHNTSKSMRIKFSTVDDSETRSAIEMLDWLAARKDGAAIPGTANRE
jgi:hypothetical protein